MTPGHLFIVGLLAFGVVAGLVLATVPGARDWPVPVLMWPLAVAFLAEVVLLPKVRDGRIAPITMPERAIGVVGSAVVIFAIGALLRG
jgi:hypothetical protein